MRSPPHPYQRGQILILVALLMVVLIGFVGLAIDSGRSYGVKAKLSSAVDAAAIAGARALAQGASDPLRQAAALQAAKDFYAANFPAHFDGATLVPLTNADVSATHDLASGYWTVNVKGSATMPVTLMGMLGFTDVTVTAEGGTIRRDLDIILVLDSSGSIGASLPGLKAAAINFVNKFNSGTNGDRVGLVTFASGGVLDVPIDKSGARGFDKTNVINHINALTSNGATAAAEGMRLALNDINGVPIASRSSLRMIVFFSDGAPNEVPATFCNGPVTASGPLAAGRCTVTPVVDGDLYSDTTGSATDAATQYFNYKLLSDASPGTLVTKSGSVPVGTLPVDGSRKDPKTTGALVPGSDIPLASYNFVRTLDMVSPVVPGSLYPYTNTRCNVNKAARNMVENVANTARSQNIKLYSIGLGAAVNTQEITFTGGAPLLCGYGASDLGANILKRLANAADAVPRNAAQPTGLYVWAANASDLDAAFSKIASEILRLSK